MLEGLTIATASIFLLAGLVKGALGLGLPTVAMGLLVVVMSPAQAAALIFAPSLVTNLWQATTGSRLSPLLRRFWPMLLATCLGVWVAARLLPGALGDGAGGVLGVLLACYAASGLFGIRIVIPPRAEPWLSPMVGLATGAATAATGIFVMPAVPYFQALGLDKDELVQALGLSFTVSTLALGLSLFLGGALRAEAAGASLLALAPALAGMWLGQAGRGRIGQAAFRRCFFVALALLGAHLALRNAV
jgi:uncharacterized membrane protein YfcA